MDMGSSLQVAYVLIKYGGRCRVADPDPMLIFRIRLTPDLFHKIYDTLKNMVMRMSKYVVLLVIILVLITGCMTPVPKDTPSDIQVTGSVEVSSTPTGAEVYLDNVYKGTTPVTIVEQPGYHIIELRLRDRQLWSKSIQIVGGTKVYIDTALAPVPVLTSLQTTIQTTHMVTVPTTRSQPVSTPTTPIDLQPPVNISGTYQGYTKDSPHSSEAPFTIAFEQHERSLWGTIGTHETLSVNGPSKFYGTVNGNKVIFGVIHTNTQTVHVTIWDGVYDPASGQVTGRWYIGISTGTFVITIS